MGRGPLRALVAPVARDSEVGRAGGVSLDVEPAPRQEARAEARRSQTPFIWTVLSGIVTISLLARLLALRGHTTPRLFPDEYIYAAIGQSLARGEFLIRDGPARFPALLEPLLAAPLWGLFSPETAYRLVQMQNALAMSLTAVPVFLLARRLRLSPRYSLACAVFAIALPDLVFSAYTTADPVAYPLVLAAIAAAVHALDTGARRAQLLFVTFAGLATFARIQFLALFVAFAAAALVTERVGAFKKYRVTLLLILVPLAAAAAAGPARVLGYYSVISDLRFNANVITWFGLHAFLLALVAGVALIPGALVAWMRPRDRLESVFARFTVALAAVLILEAAVYAANGAPRFKERYVFMLLPLVPIAFGLYLRNGRPHPRIVTLIALGLGAVIARLPLSAYSAGDGRVDSPFLTAVSQLDQSIGTATSSLVVAALATIAVAAAILAAWRGGGRYILLAGIGTAVLMSLGAVSRDLRSNQLVERDLPQEKNWVDAHEAGDVTAIQTPSSPRGSLLTQLYWNESVKREVVLPGAIPTDAFRAPVLRVRPDGSLPEVSGAILFHDYGTTASFADAELVDRRRSFTLWRPRAAVRLRLLITGRYGDGWAAQKGLIRVWRERPGERETFSFRLSLPKTAKQPTTMTIGRRIVRIAPGNRRSFSYVLRPGPGLTIPFSADIVTNLVDHRFLSVRMTDLRFGD